MSKKVIITWSGIDEILNSLNAVNETIVNYRKSIPVEHEEVSKKVINVLEHRIEENRKVTETVEATLTKNRLVGGVYKSINTENSSEYLTHLNSLEEAIIETTAMVETILTKIGERIKEDDKSN